MERSIIFQKVKEIFNDTLDEIEVDLTDTTTADDVEEWDSITHIELISEIENRFNFRMSIREIENLKNLGDMISLIESKVEVSQ